MTTSRRSQLVLSTLLLASSSTSSVLSTAASSQRYLRSTSIQAQAVDDNSSGDNIPDVKDTRRRILSAADNSNLPWVEDESISSGDNIPTLSDTRRILSATDNNNLPWEEDESSISSGDNLPTLADARRLQEAVAAEEEAVDSGIGLAQLIDRKPNKKAKKADPKPEPKALSIATTNITTEDNTTVLFATIIEVDENEEITVNTTEGTPVNTTNATTLTNITKELRVEELIQEEEIYISQKCLNTLEASAGDNGRLGPEDYYIFTDGMSNGYFTLNNMTTYSDLPMVNKFAFVTLSCQCSQFGGRDNCCQGPRANLNVQGINTTDVDSMDEQLKDYIIDICKTTIDAIGEDNVLDRGERDSGDEEEPPMEGWWDSPTSKPSSAPSLSVSPTNSPTVTPPFDGIVDNSGGGNSNDLSSSGLSGGAIAGIAIAAVVVLALIAYVLMPRKDKEEENEEFQLARIEDGNDNDLEQIEAGDNDDGSVVSNKELLAITNGEDTTSSGNTAEF